MGLIGLGKTLALELGRDGFTIAPTAVDTPLFRDDAQYRDMVPHLYQQEHSFAEREAAVKELLATSVHALPVPWVEPRDVADAVTYLVSDRARYITGIVLDVAAGSNAHHVA